MFLSVYPPSEKENLGQCLCLSSPSGASLESKSCLHICKNRSINMCNQTFSYNHLLLPCIFPLVFLHKKYNPLSYPLNIWNSTTTLSPITTIIITHNTNKKQNTTKQQQQGGKVRVSTLRRVTTLSLLRVLLLYYSYILVLNLYYYYYYTKIYTTYYIY